MRRITLARQARERSNSGIYHIMLRGIDKRNIFIDDVDREKFINGLIKAKKNGDFDIYAYCLMNNHVHLLIKEKEEIGKTIKRITVGYVSWYNSKYERTGHLFQNRYKSEPVQTEGYLITVFRYIHQNPMKAGMVNKLEDYKWSSYNQYLNSYQGIDPFIDTELIRTYFSRVVDFISYVNANNSDECLDYKPVQKYNDDTLKNKISQKYIIGKLLDLPINERNEMINNIYNESRASIRQLSRVLGVGKTIVERAVKEDR